MRKAVLVAALAMLSGPAWPAIQEPVDPQYQLPVPKEQRKVTVGESKAFQEGALTLGAVAADQAAVMLAVNGGPAQKVPHATPTLFDIGGDRICTVNYIGLVGKQALLSARCDPASDALRAALAKQASAAAIVVVDPEKLVADAPKDSLTNPYLGDRAAIAEGHQLFLAYSCNGCHGGGGGGGMGPPFTNGVWIYGDKDDTLFRLVTLGSDGLQAAGYSRIARESVVGPMPPFGGIIQNADELWKILAWVRSVSLSDAPPLK